MKKYYSYAERGDFELRFTTFFGLEEVLAKEIQKLGGRNVQVFRRGVSATGDLGFLYKCNLCLHTALKVLVPVVSFTAESEHELYERTKAVAWEDFIGNDDTLMVESVTNSERFTHTLFVSQKIKDGIVDRFRDNTGQRPSVDLLRPTFRVYAHIFRNEVTLLLDASGDPLYKRGYRSDVTEASLKEVLAAGLVKLSGWEKHLLLIDGMCGAGTIAIEAALWANNIPPGYYRNDFTCMRWRNFDEKLYETIYESAINRITGDPVNIVANEIEPSTFRKAVTNTRNAKVDDVVKCTNQSFFDLKPERQGGVLILNPPYGERMPVREIEKLYAEIGNKLKKDFEGFNAWIITSNPEAIKSIGLRPSRKIQVYNGALDCRYLKFEMYGGSRKASKNPASTDRR